MNCTWGYTWHGRYLYHSWFFWLLVIVTLVTALVCLWSYLHRKQQPSCPCCHSQVDEVYMRCPECGEGLKSHCPGCHHIVNNSWQCCPNCKKTLQPEMEKEPPTAGTLPA